jgi:hypothetical protein
VKAFTPDVVGLQNSEKKTGKRALCSLAKRSTSRGLSLYELEHSRLKAKIVCLLDLGQVIGQLILIPWNPLRHELNLVIPAKLEKADTDFLKVVSLGAAFEKEEKHVQSVAADDDSVTPEEMDH